MILLHWQFVVSLGAFTHASINCLLTILPDLPLLSMSNNAVRILQAVMRRLIFFSVRLLLKQPG